MKYLNLMLLAFSLVVFCFSKANAQVITTSEELKELRFLTGHKSLVNYESLLGNPNYAFVPVDTIKHVMQITDYSIQSKPKVIKTFFGKPDVMVLFRNLKDESKEEVFSIFACQTVDGKAIAFYRFNGLDLKHIGNLPNIQYFGADNESVKYQLFAEGFHFNHFIIVFIPMEENYPYFFYKYSEEKGFEFIKKEEINYEELFLEE